MILNFSDHERGEHKFVNIILCITKLTDIRTSSSTTAIFKPSIGNPC